MVLGSVSMSDVLYILLQNHTHIRNIVYNIDIQ